MRTGTVPSGTPPVAARPHWHPSVARGAANTAQASAQLSVPVFTPRSVSCSLSCSSKHGSLLVANAVRADQAAPAVSQDTLELISRLTKQVDDAHTDILRRSEQSVPYVHLCWVSFLLICVLFSWVTFNVQVWLLPRRLAALGPGSDLKQRVLATVQDVQQGLLERETEVRPLLQVLRVIATTQKIVARSPKVLLYPGTADDPGGAGGRALAAARPARHGEERAVAPPVAPHGRLVL